MQKEKIDPKLITVLSVGVCAALMTICSWISIPIVVPFTLQTFAVFLIAGLFSLKVSMLSITVFIALGAVGLPVFSGFKSGLAAVMGPTGGYMVGFLFTALIIWLFKTIKPSSVPFLVIGMSLGLAVCYMFGTIWFYIVYARTGNVMSGAKILSLCVLPFLIPDAVKMALAVLLVNRLTAPLSKMGFVKAE